MGAGNKSPAEARTFAATVASHSGIGVGIKPFGCTTPPRFWSRLPETSVHFFLPDAPPWYTRPSKYSSSLEVHQSRRRYAVASGGVFGTRWRARSIDSSESRAKKSCDAERGGCRDGVRVSNETARGTGKDHSKGSGVCVSRSGKTDRNRLLSLSRFGDPSDKCLDCQSGATSRPPRRENRACGGSDSSSNVFVVTRNRVERARRAKPKSKWNSDGKETPFRGHGAPAVRATVALPAITTRRRDICVYRAALTLVRGCVRARPGRRSSPGSARNRAFPGKTVSSTRRMTRSDRTNASIVNQARRVALRGAKTARAEDQIRHLMFSSSRPSVIRVSSRGAREARTDA